MLKGRGQSLQLTEQKKKKKNCLQNTLPAISQSGGEHGEDLTRL